MAFRVHIPVLGFKKLGRQLSEEKIFALQQELFSGCTAERDYEIRKELIDSATKLTFVIARRFAAYRKNDREELAEVAWLELCECTNRLSKSHSNYYAYVNLSVSGTLRNYLKSEHTIWIPRSQYKTDTKATEESPVTTYTEYSDDTPLCYERRNHEIDNAILEDYLQSDEFTDRGKEYLRARLQGYSGKEIAEQLGISEASVSNIRVELGRKFRQMMKGI